MVASKIDKIFVNPQNLHILMGKHGTPKVVMSQDQVENLYEETGCSVEAFAQTLGVTVRKVRNILRKNKLDPSFIKT